MTMISWRYFKSLKISTAAGYGSAATLLHQPLEVILPSSGLGLRNLSSTKAEGALNSSGATGSGGQRDKSSTGRNEPRVPIIPTNKINRPRLIHQSSSSSCPSAGAGGTISPSHLRFPHDDYHETDLSKADQLRKAYDDAYQYCKSKKLPEDVDPHAVFACNRLNLRDIQVYGFDYDYTLANYKPELERLIYNLGRDVLINVYKYPKEVENLQYNPSWQVRGLLYDFKRGLLLKLDTSMQIQLGCVYRGLTPLSDEEVIAEYGSRKIPLSFVDEGPNRDYGKPCMVQLSDLFSLPEMNLLSNVTEYLHQHNYDYSPESLYRDIKESIYQVHPKMHKIVLNDPETYLEKDPKLRQYLTALKSSGKQLFLVTNSPYPFVDRGLSYILGDDWIDFFHVTIVGAKKPYFFSGESNPFRLYDPDMDARLWDRVTSLEPGKVYYGGTLQQFMKMTGWKGQNVLYFGDHPYSDLADVTLHHGWRTGAIIKELQHEIETLNTPDFKFDMNWQNFMTSLLETYQDLDDPQAQPVIREWQAERNQIRKRNKEIFNPQFGSMFRTHLNPTFFSRRVFRFADIYTSNITNLLRYSVRHTFYPRRGALPHEYRSWMN